MTLGIPRVISSNIYVFIGILFGLFLSSLISETVKPLCQQNISVPQGRINAKIGVMPSIIQPEKKPNSSSKKAKPFRPRYYSTELGIREKLFIGIFTSEDKINSQAIHLNNTIKNVANKVNFFISAKYKLKTKFNLTGIVGFTDTRPKYRPFQVFMYIGNNFVQDYDYFFLANDYTFVNGYKLNDLVKKISVSMDVYLGTKVPDSSFCNLDAGIVISNSVLKAVTQHLDWCIMNAISDDNSENIGRCIHYSIGITCQEEIQSQSLDSFKLKHFELDQHLLELTHSDDFNKAVTVYPILQSDNFYMLNSYYLRERLVWIKNEIDTLSQDLTDTWPPGHGPGAKPATRFDVARQLYFNSTHMFHPDDFTNLRQHTPAELADIQNILDEVRLKYEFENGDKFKYRRLINGYRVFDLSRGMDYILDLGFRDLNTGQEVIKRFEVCKPLGKVEFIPVPYVTENSRVTVILSVQETEIDLALDFLKEFSAKIMDKKEKLFVMLAFLYQFNSSNKDKDDVFYKIKDLATKIANKYKNEDSVKIMWVSIRLPERQERVLIEHNRVLNFAIVDLALKKIGLESLILILDPYANVTGDFLNRVRMNTIKNYQIFSMIPFRQYDPRVSLGTGLDVNKQNGHFDSEEYKYISFYSKDYVEARKKFQHKVPLTRVDNDISNILEEPYRTTGNIFEMFVLFGGNIHAMRAVEMGLKVKYHEETDPARCNLFVGNQLQLAKLLLTKQNEIPALN